jgi:hypothetical protein
MNAILFSGNKLGCPPRHASCPAQTRRKLAGSLINALSRALYTAENIAIASQHAREGGLLDLERGKQGGSLEYRHMTADALARLPLPQEIKKLGSKP